MRLVESFVLTVLIPASLLSITAEAVVASTQDAASDVFMQIGAHPDDDLLFMNPDMMNTIGAGNGTVTIIMTAAEAGGGVDGTPKAQFAFQRQEGLRAAYAYMAGVANSWGRSALWVVDHWVEYDTLFPAPQIHLLFINLPDGGDPDNMNSLLTLYNDSTAVRYTFPPDGSTVITPYGYTKATLRRTVLELFKTFQPTFIRTLDPQPPLICGGYDQYGNCTEWLHDDEPDHINTARFVDLALQDYHGPQGSRFYGTFYYKGLPIADQRGNLGANDYTRKRSVCDIYKQFDVNFRYYENAYAGLFGGTYERYGGSTTWLQPMSDGRLAAFGVQDRQVVQWKESSAGGSWIGPGPIGGGPVAPHIDVGRYDDGRIRLVALQIPVAGAIDFPTDPQYGQHIITSVQSGPNGPFGPWENLGNPDGFGWPNYDHWTGMPAISIDASGYAEVFARNAAGGVSRCVQTGGGWTIWETLPSVTYDDVLDGIVSIRANDGRIEVFATYRSGDMAHWRQRADGGYDLDSSFPPINVASPPTVTKNQDGRPEIFYREAGSAHVLTTYFTNQGTWSTSAVDLAGDGGIGPIASMLRGASGQIMLLARNDYNGVSANWQVAPNSAFQASWLDLGGEIPGFPSSANDATGRVVMAALGTDGRLYIRRETSPNSIGSFGPWTVVGNSISNVGPAPAIASALEAISPNPFNPNTTIRYSVARPGPVRLEIYDIRGARVASLVDRNQDGGTYSVVWSGSGDHGERLASGVYLARLQTGVGAWSRKLVLSK